MSVQIFLQGKLLGIEAFLLARGPEPVPERELAGRSQWVSLLAEVLPRALLAELKLARILLGTSGGGQFLVVLPGESKTQAEDFLAAAQEDIERISQGRLRLLWASTENLGDWSLVRKRLSDEMQQKRSAPAPRAGAAFFEPLASGIAAPADSGYFGEELGLSLREASSVGWSPDAPGRIRVGAGKHTWPLSETAEAISLARHAAPSDDARQPAETAALAARAEGRALWGVLRGDADNFGIRLRRVQSIEEHIQLSVLFKQFFAGELEVLCSMPEFWRKVSILHTGGDDFAVYGAWDALILLARELERLFGRFVDANLKDFPGPEGKSLSMALALAPEPGAVLADVYEDAGRKLDLAKAAFKGCFHLLGRTLEWSQLTDAGDLKELIERLVRDFGCSTQFLADLGAFYRETGGRTGRGRGARFDRPWRLHRRMPRYPGGAREREFQKLRGQLVAELTGKHVGAKLRPSGRVALEWAKLSTEA